MNSNDAEQFWGIQICGIADYTVNTAACDGQERLNAIMMAVFGLYLKGAHKGVGCAVQIYVDKKEQRQPVGIIFDII